MYMLKTTFDVLIDPWRPTGPPAPSELSPCTGPHHSASLHPNPLEPTFIRWVTPYSMSVLHPSNSLVYVYQHKMYVHIHQYIYCICVFVCSFLSRPIWFYFFCNHTPLEPFTKLQPSLGLELSCFQACWQNKMTASRVIDSASLYIARKIINRCSIVVRRQRKMRLKMLLFEPFYYLFVIKMLMRREQGWFTKVEDESWFVCWEW